MLDLAKSPVAQKLRASAEKVGAGLTVLRALPKPPLDAVGPFVFLDHFGPAAPPAGGVPAHPHAGIEVVTYLIDGENDHRDSMGNVGAIKAGGAQWITSGRGMLHAEFPRCDANGLAHMAQLWARQPLALDDAAPAYHAIEADEVPQRAIERGRLRLLAGKLPDLFAVAGPVALAMPALLLHLTLEPGGEFAAPLDDSFEMGVYALAGVATIGATDIGRGELALLAPARSVAIVNHRATTLEALLLGGARAARPLMVRGPYVFNSAAAIERAQRDFVEGRMGRLDGVPF